MHKFKVEHILLAIYFAIIIFTSCFAYFSIESFAEEDLKIDTPTTMLKPLEKVKESIAYSLSDEEIELVALIVMAEAEGQPEYGQRLVIDTILNRVDDDYWPSTVHDVIYQKNQFECVSNGRTSRCYVKKELVSLVKEELVSRTNTDVRFFRAGHFSEYGVPMFKEGDHYFSSLN